MEAREPGTYFLLIDNKARAEGLALVEASDDAHALIEAARQHFDERVESITAERVLREFADEKLSPRLKHTEGFDPVLFKAVALFELAHLQEDESVITECVQMLADVWANPTLSDGSLELNFTAPTKRARYSPFDAYSDFIIWSCIEEYTENRPTPPRQEKADPLKEQIDGRESRLTIGRREVESAEDPVLTHQLIRDLRKLFPAHIVHELSFRFPENGTFDDVYPLIQQIQHERKQGILPPADEIIAAFAKARATRTNLSGAPRSKRDRPTMQAQEALDMFRERFRDTSARLIGNEIYVPQLKAWFVVMMLASETEVNTFYRRIWHGDATAEGTAEAKPEEKLPVIEAHRVLGRVYDVCGSWEV